MSRFVDRQDTGTLDLGPCQCPGTPHKSDQVTLRKQLSGLEWAESLRGTNATLATLIVSWNFCDESGPVEVNEANVAAIDLATFRQIDEWVAANVTPPELPNGSGAPSRNGTRASASRTPTTRRKG